MHGFFYSDIEKTKKPHGFCGVLEYLPWPFSAAGQEHKESVLVLFAGCTISWGGVDEFKSRLNQAAWPPLGSASWEIWN